MNVEEFMNIGIGNRAEKRNDRYDKIIWRDILNGL